MFEGYPSKYIVLDIETRNLTPEQAEFEGLFVKSHPRTKDETKKAAQIEAKKAELSEKGALSNSAEIACIGVYDNTLSAPIVLHTFDFNKRIEGVDHFKFKDEREMLVELYSMLDVSCDDLTEIVVANADFELPKIRYRSAIKNRVKIPRIFIPHSPNPVYDVLYNARKYFLLGSEYISLDTLDKHIGGECSGKVISGKEIPNMIDEERFEEVITYNAVDVMKTRWAYLTMTCNC